MKPHDYFDTFVRPNYLHFSREQSNLRLAMNAVISTHHMLDCVAWSTFKGTAAAKKGEFTRHRSAVEQHACAKCNGLRVVADVASAYKHIKIWPCIGSRKRAFTDLVNIEEYPGEPFHDGTFFSDGTGFASARRRVTVRDDHGQRHDLWHVLRSAVEYWEKHLATSAP